jgi:Tol biopolymer transport system component
MLRLAAGLALLITTFVAVAPAQAQKGRMTRVSVADDEAQANGSSATPSVSADGRLVAFRSSASNLVEGDTNGLDDIFLRDRIAETTIRVNVNNNKEQTTGSDFATGGSSSPSISADGRFVAFASNASNLVERDTNGKTDVFVRDLHEGRTILVSANENGEVANERSDHPRISADGTTVVFASFATDLAAGESGSPVDLYVRDISEKERGTELVSVDSGEVARGSEFEHASISGDGNLVVFSAESTLLVPGDANGGANDIFLRDRAAGTTTRVNVDDNGVQPTFFTSDNPVISTDGRFVAYTTAASRFIDPNDSGSAADVFVHDLRKRQTSIASLDGDGVRTNSSASLPTLSGDGQFVAFASSASNLTTTAGGGLSKVFLRDRKRASTQFASFNASGGVPSTHASGQALSANGNVLALSTAATDIVAGDTNAVTDVFVNDLAAPSPAAVFTGANGPVIRDGRMASSSWSVTFSGTGLAIAPLAPTAMPSVAASCVSGTPIVCPGATRVFADLGDGDDRYNAAGCNDANVSGTLSGGDGNDFLVGGPGVEGFFGGPGNDRFIGCAGRDDFFGGAGFDRVDYPGSAAVTVKVNNEHVSGLPGEQDLIGGDVEHVVTGSGNDRLEGGATLDGGAGDDVFLGQGSGTVLIGGPGVDRLDARAGSQTLMARDGVADARIDCGTEIDAADLDLLDSQTNCENVTQGAVGERPNVELGATRTLKLRDGRIAVVITCPRAVRHPCAGTLVAARTTSRLARAPKTRYSVRAGRSATVRVRADKSVRRRARAYLQSIEKGDVRGVKTTRSFVRIAR